MFFDSFPFSSEGDFQQIITTRYDANLTSVTRSRDADGKKIIIVHSNWGHKALEPQDSGYAFPRGQDIKGIREHTSVDSKPDFTTERTTYVVLNEDDLNRATKDSIKKCVRVFEMRLLFIKQQYNRIQGGAEFFGFRKLDGYYKFLELMMVKFLIGNELEDSLYHELPGFVTEHAGKSCKVRSVIGKTAYDVFSSVELDNIPFSINHLTKNILGGLMASTPCDWTIYLNHTTSVMGDKSTFKTTERAVYNEAREWMAEQWKRDHGPSDEMKNCEVLLYNDNMEVVEGSITNIAVRKEIEGVSTLITPRLTTGCLAGIMRYYLLKKDLIQEGDVTLSDLEDGEELLIFNSVMGVKKAKLVMLENVP